MHNTGPMETEGPLHKYRALNAELIVETARRLNTRLQERFSGSGLSRVCLEFVAIAEAAGPRSERLSRPLWGLRIGVAIARQPHRPYAHRTVPVSGVSNLYRAPLGVAR